MKLILVPTDFSPCANNAVKYAIQLAKLGKFELLFFHSVDSLKSDAELLKKYPEEYRMLKERAEDKLQKNIFAQYKKIGVRPGKIKYVVKFGESFTKQIYELSTNVKADLLVLGTHGAGKIKAALMGSNTSHLIANSKIPVLSVPAHCRFVPLKELIYLSDLNSVSEEMKRLQPLCKKLKAKLSVMHFDYGWVKESEEMKAIKKLVSAKVNFRNIKVSIEIPLLHHIKNHHKHGNSLICLFHDKKNLFQKYLTGSNAEEASMKLHAPVLSIQRKN